MSKRRHKKYKFSKILIIYLENVKHVYKFFSGVYDSCMKKQRNNINRKGNNKSKEY